MTARLAHPQRGYSDVHSALLEALRARDGVVTAEELASAVWGYASPYTIRAAVHRARRLLEADAIGESIVVRSGRGYELVRGPGPS